jgi:hypothetical protein
MPSYPKGSTVPNQPRHSNAFSASLLDRLAERDEPPTAGEADVAGPWRIEPAAWRGAMASACSVADQVPANLARPASSPTRCRDQVPANCDAEMAKRTGLPTASEAVARLRDQPRRRLIFFGKRAPFCG